MNKDTRDKLYNIAYYLIIGLVSILSMAFFPMVGTQIGLAWNLPDTPVGWGVWAISKIAVALVNMLLFHCFLQQAKVNVRDNEKYKKAREILQKTALLKQTKPHSPSRFNREQYLGKGTSLFLSSLLSAIGFSQAILTFDLLMFISLAFTVIMGIIFGYISMRKAEEYWTEEYYEYALMEEERLKKEQEQGGNADGIRN